MQPRSDIVDRNSPPDDLLRFRGTNRSRIREAIQVFAISFKVRQVSFTGYRYLDHLAPLFRFADLPNRHARRRVGERTQVAVNLSDGMQDVRRADNRSEMIKRRWNGARCRKMVHERAQELRIGGILVNQASVLGIVCIGR